MISFKNNGIRFNYRCAGIFTHQERVLLHRAHQDDFWALPGGRCEFGETATRTIIREMFEELGVFVTVKGLRFVVENFFTYEKESVHELGMYFDACFADESPLVARQGSWSSETEPELEFRWFRREELANIQLKPQFLEEHLFDFSSQPKHIVVGRDAGYEVLSL